MKIRKDFRFEAAHQLPRHKGKCARLHGHSYRLEVTVTGPIQEHGHAAGMVLDFADVSGCVKGQILESLDHRMLNDFIENPTAENVVTWIADNLHLPGLFSLVLWETDTACAIWEAA